MRLTSADGGDDRRVEIRVGRLPLDPCEEVEGAWCGSLRVPFDRANPAAGTLRTLEASGSVAFSEPETTYVASVPSAAVSDPLVPQQWWRSAIGVDGLTSPGPGIPVSLVDSGVNLDHPEFAGRPNLITLNTQEPQPFGGVHGTSVASVVGAQENGVGIVGVYPDAVIRSWDAATGLGNELTSSAIVNGILASSQRGRSVVNLSLGGRDPDAAIEADVNLAVARGSLVVAASGNDGEEGSPLSFPAAFPHVLTVAATQQDGSVAPFSSASRFVDLPITFSRFVLDIFFPRLERLLASHQLAFAFVYGLRSFVEAFFSTDQPLLKILELAADLSHLLLKLRSLLEHTVFSLELSLFLYGRCVFLRLLDDSRCGSFGDLSLRARLFAAHPYKCEGKQDSADQSGNSKQQTLIQ